MARQKKSDVQRHSVVVVPPYGMPLIPTAAGISFVCGNSSCYSRLVEVLTRQANRGTTQASRRIIGWRKWRAVSLGISSLRVPSTHMRRVFSIFATLRMELQRMQDRERREGCHMAGDFIHFLPALQILCRRIACWLSLYGHFVAR